MTYSSRFRVLKELSYHSLSFHSPSWKEYRRLNLYFSPSLPFLSFSDQKKLLKEFSSVLIRFCRNTWNWFIPFTFHWVAVQIIWLWVSRTNYCSRHQSISLSTEKRMDVLVTPKITNVNLLKICFTLGIIEGDENGDSENCKSCTRPHSKWFATRVPW